MLCENGHTLQECVGKPDGYQGTEVQCDLCMDFTNLENTDHFYHCEECLYDSCKVCFDQRTQYATDETISVWCCPECSYPNFFNQDASDCTNKKCNFIME